MSESFVYDLVVKTDYIQVPDSLILLHQSENELKIKIRANGFQLLRYQLSPKRVQLDLSALRQSRNRYYLTSGILRRQIGSQMTSGSTLVELETDTLYVTLEKLDAKWVPVLPDVTLDFTQNFMLDGSLKIEPERVRILGPKAEIDTIQSLNTVAVRLENIQEDILLDLAIKATEYLPNTKFSTRTVNVTGTVFKFTETLIEVPVEVINLPEQVLIKTFPPAVSVLCRGRVDDLKNLDPQAFKVQADYTNPDVESGRLRLELIEFPKRVNTAILQKHTVEFIVRRE